MAFFHQPQNDIIYTDPAFAQRIITYFNPKGNCFDPCRGFEKDRYGSLGGAFYNSLPEPREWAEIQEGKDCVDCLGPYDWAITNPPYSAKAYRKVARHCFKVSQNVVFLIRLDLAIGTYARLKDAAEFGHSIKEIIIVSYADAGFPTPLGFALAVIHWQKDWLGGTVWNNWTP